MGGQVPGGHKAADPPEVASQELAELTLAELGHHHGHGRLQWPYFD